MGEFRGTPKQYEILRLVVDAAIDCKVISLKELWKSLSYGSGVTKQAIMRSLEILDDHGFIRRVWGKEHSPVHIRGTKQFIQPTLKAYQLLRRTPG